jgi:folate-binding protein YgfZ
MPLSSPLASALSRTNAVLTEEFGWQVAAHFGDTAAEYAAATEGAAVFDVSHRGKVEVSGPDAAAFLHNLCTNDVRRLGAGTGCEVFFTNAQARVLAHGYVFHLMLQNWPKPGDRREVYALDLDPGLADKVVRHLNQYRISEDVEAADVTRAYAQLHLAGPEAQSVLEKALRGDLQGLADLQDVERTFRSPTLRPGAPAPQSTSQAATAMIRIPSVATCHVRRYQRVGLPGYDLLCQASRAETVWQYVTSAGAVPAGMDTYHALRIEAGTPAYGLDIDESNLAPEVGRTPQAISYTKGCYLGQEPIVRIRDLGHVNRVLVGLKVEAPAPVPRGSKVFHDGKEVGQITSSAASPKLRAIAALAYLRRDSQKPDTRLQVDTGSGRYDAVVTLLPAG